MLNKKDFIKYLNDFNAHSSEVGLDGLNEDFVAFDSKFGISKTKINTSAGGVRYYYYLYCFHFGDKTFSRIQTFKDLKLAKKALKALTTVSK